MKLNEFETLNAFEDMRAFFYCQTCSDMKLIARLAALGHTYDYPDTEQALTQLASSLALFLFFHVALGNLYDQSETMGGDIQHVEL